MTPYLTRKHTSSTASSQETQNKTVVSKIISKTKQPTNKTSKMKDYAKVINTRSRIQTRKAKNEKDDMSVSQAENIAEKEQEKSTRHKKLPEEDVNIKTRAQRNLTRSNSNANKQETKDKKKKITSRVKKNASNSRQMLLKESFLNHSKIRLLRSHNNSKDNPALVKETSIKKANANRKKQPIYECVSPENSKEGTNEIYEFKFDINDSKERLPKKRKKKVTIRKATVNKKKKNIVNVERNLQKTKVSKKTPIISKLEENKEKDPVESVENKISIEPLSETENLVENSEKNIDENRESKEPENTIKEQIEDKKTTKPTIVLIENFNDKRILVESVPQVSNSSELFRPTNTFINRLTVQQKNAINSSLFEKSLSPIMKSSENIQSNSPWRASPLHTFSQVKTVFQSTPQNKKHNVLSKTFVRPVNGESKQYGNIGKAKSNLQRNDENMSTENHTVNTPKRKNTLTSRKFGTEITNIDHSLHANSTEHINEQVVMENVNIQSNRQSVTSNISDSIKFDNSENKMTNTLSPRTSFKKETNKIKFRNQQESVLNTQADEQKENFDPQPGPSGLQILPFSNEGRVLRQSNLNNFLNIMEIPQSTTIKTPHGLFDDGQSTAPGNRSVIKLNEPNMEIKNAFGFDDEDSNQDTSVQDKITNDKKEEKETIQKNFEQFNTKPTTRLSIGDIKNKLLVKKLKEGIQNETKEIKKSPMKKKNEQRIIDITTFSDTFDVQSETNESSAMNASEIPLFADMEPSHFTTPPRYSYKRKRAARFSFSEDGEREEEMLVKREKKRNKDDKLKKEQNKRLMEWVKNINETFSEIDQHELMIV
ncbi:hypothetical protein ANTPLA_LOCUS5863 [Anthophora plagiata]